MRLLRLDVWLRGMKRHFRAAHHLMREHVKQAIFAGVFDRALRWRFGAMLRAHTRTTSARVSERGLVAWQ